MAKEYDYLLKVLLVGDSDVGKTEILNNLEDALDEDCENLKMLLFVYVLTFHFLFSDIQDYNHFTRWQKGEITGECDGNDKICCQ